MHRPHGRHPLSQLAKGKFVRALARRNFPIAGSAGRASTSLSDGDHGRGTLTTDVAPGRPATVMAAGALGVALAVSSVVLPYMAYLRRPDLISLVAGLIVLGGGLVLLRNRAVGPVGWLVLGAGYTWFLPSLAVSGRPGLDTALRCTALLHVALLIHAVIVVGAPHVRGRPEWLAVGLGYVAALTAVVGLGFRVALPVAGVSVVVAVLGDTSHLRASVRTLRAAAGLVLGLGLVGDAVLRALAGPALRPESWIAVDHPVEIAATAVLIALAGTRRTAWDVIDVRTDTLGQLTTILAHELGAPDLGIALSDGAGGWLRPTGEEWGTSPPYGLAVPDSMGAPCAVLEGSLAHPVTPAVEDVLRLAAANARLRHSIVVQVDQLEASRRRLLSAADWERASLGTQLRTRVIAPVAAMERELARSPSWLPHAREPPARAAPWKPSLAASTLSAATAHCAAPWTTSRPRHLARWSSSTATIPGRATSPEPCGSAARRPRPTPPSTHRVRACALTSEGPARPCERP